MSLGPLLLGAALGQLAAILASRRAPGLWLVGTVGGAVAGIVAAGAVLFGGAPAWDWLGGFRIGGQEVHLRLDAISAIFLLLLGVVGSAGAIYGREYWPDTRHPRSAPGGRLWWNAMLLSMGFILVCANGLHFLIGWELFTVSAYFLVSLERGQPEGRSAGWLYLAASHAGTLCLFAFFAALAARRGTWDLGPMRDDPRLAPLFWLALLGFGVKAGIFPLHVWLPSAHANSPSHVSSIMSGMAIKMGVYGIVRFSGWLPVPAAAAWTLPVLGAASAVLGVAFALGQHDLKRLLAYHSVENIGIILLGLGFAVLAAREGAPLWGQLALAGALLHVWNHGLFKSLLFLGAGSVAQATGTREMSRLGGLWRAMPWTATLFALGAAAISGLPPLNGFVSEWLVYLGLLDGVTAHGPAAWAILPGVILLALTGALALACFTKVCGVVFLGAPRTERARRARECGATMRAPMLLLAAGCVAIGLAPAVFWPAVVRATAAWSPAWPPVAAPSSLFALGWAQVAVAVAAIAGSVALAWRARRTELRRAVTWDCGYAEPTARMQYTAGSFAATITGWFDWILRPRTHAEPPEGAFPDHAAYASHTPETVLEHVVSPVAAVILRVSARVRRLQHGRVQAYLFYVVLGAAALAVIVMTGGPQ